MEKINKCLNESVVYLKLKALYLFLLGAFRETFVYKLFFGDINDESLQKGLFGKLFYGIKKPVLWIYDVISDVFIVKIIKKIFSFDFWSILKDSEILKFFSLAHYRFSLPFLALLLLLFSAGILPTMAVAGLSVLIFILMFFEDNFKDRINEMKPVASDIFIVFYLIALIHARNVSVDYQRNNIFLIYFVFVGVYFAFRYYLSSLDKVKSALSAFCVSGLLISAYGIFQFVTGAYKTTIWTDTALFSDIEGRLVSTFENPNVFGEYLLLLIPVTIALFFITDKFFWKLVYGGTFVLSCLCMVLTYSRGCWIGLILGIGILILMAYPKILLPIGILAPFSLFFIPESIITRITSIGNLKDGSTAFRVYLWKSTIDMIKDVWYKGIGLGTDNFIENYRPYSYEAVVAPHCHNTFLHVMCESGIFGLVVFVLLLYFVLRQLFNVYKNAENKEDKLLSSSLVAGIMGLTVQAMFDNTLYNYRMYMLFFAVLAIASALYAKGREKREN